MLSGMLPIMSGTPGRNKPEPDHAELICHRCGCALERGEGTCWFVRIDAVCDPSPPQEQTDQPLESLAADYERLLAQMSAMSERELMDQVHRRMVLHLCSRCFERWYDRPVG